MIMGKIWRGLEEEELVGLMGFGWGGGRWEVGGGRWEVGGGR